MQKYCIWLQVRSSALQLSPPEVFKNELKKYRLNFSIRNCFLKRDSVSSKELIKITLNSVGISFKIYLTEIKTQPSAKMLVCFQSKNADTILSRGRHCSSAQRPL
ncbi:breast cancer metastasis-suppressor 1 [Platysternon megacephalum]|uniref:Breast cancer metastasis-suppressor 1 n=1 Tax=Platysternon megacephalum TaxID=55544 RepID=A0A4D9EQE3_9SAUR|nr:breast cancer metastasis-suppressor 1 [Platysternon megacephalum]